MKENNYTLNSIIDKKVNFINLFCLPLLSLSYTNMKKDKN